MRVVNNDVLNVSIRDHMVAQAAHTGGFFEALAALNVASIELQIDLDYTLPHLAGADAAKDHSVADSTGSMAVARLFESRGVRVCALLLATDFSAEHVAEQVAWAVRCVRVAHECRAPVVRLDPLTRNKELPPDRVRANFVAAVREVLRATADTNVDLAIENHGPVGNDPAFLDAVFDAVDDPRLGLTLDTGNFYWWGVSLDELYVLLTRYAPRAKHTHIKNINYPPDLARQRRPVGEGYKEYCCPLDEGNLDLSHVISILRDAGYVRDLCIENESLFKYPGAQKLDVLRRDVAALRRAVGGWTGFVY